MFNSLNNFFFSVHILLKTEIDVTHQSTLYTLRCFFFLLARLNSPFVAPGQYSDMPDFICQKSTKRNTLPTTAD